MLCALHAACFTHCIFTHPLQVRNQESGVPQLVAVSSAVSFESLRLTIHSYSADWLYQGLLYIFSGTIKRQVEEALDGAMHTVRAADSVVVQHYCTCCCARNSGAMYMSSSSGNSGG